MSDPYDNVTISLTVVDDEEPFTQRLAFDVTVQRGEARFAVNALAQAVDAALQAHPGFAGAISSEERRIAAAGATVREVWDQIKPKCGDRATWEGRPEGDNISTCEREPHPLLEAHEGPTQKGTMMAWSTGHG